MFKKFLPNSFFGKSAVSQKQREEIDALFRQGLQYRDQGNYPKAEESLKKALEKDPESEIIKLKLWQIKNLNKQNHPSSSITNNNF